MNIFLKLTGISIQSRLYYKTSFLIDLITPLIQLMASFLLWNALYTQQQENNIKNMHQTEMFSYILIAFAINNLLSFSSENMLSKEIRSGTVVTRLIRPTTFLLQIICEMLGPVLLQLIVNSSVAVAGFLLFSKFFKIPSIKNLLFFIPCVILSIILRIMLIEISSLLCFFSTGYLGISWTRDALMNFFSGSLLPVTFFPHLLMQITYITPFPYILQVPVSILLGQNLPMKLPQVYIMQIIWIIGLVGLHYAIFSHIRRNMNIAGG